MFVCSLTVSRDRPDLLHEPGAAFLCSWSFLAVRDQKFSLPGQEADRLPAFSSAGPRRPGGSSQSSGTRRKKKHPEWKKRNKTVCSHR